ncbi:MAG: tetratricopeptide repeat protein [Chloroflexia bacterium]|nr:tetratricopeptide repeat protein [Chloroflexia bacterium]
MAVVGVLVLIVPTVLIALEQGRSGTQDPQVAALLARLESNPDDLEALISLGNLYFEEGVYWWDQNDMGRSLDAFERAAAYYESALRLEPDNADVRTDLGTMYYYQGQLRDSAEWLQAAVREWELALAYEPDKIETLYNLGIGYLALDQIEQARAMWQRVIEVAPDSADAQRAQQMLDQYGP